MVFCYQNWSHLLWERVVLLIEKKWRLRICKFFEITRTIYSNSERSDQFLETDFFLTCSWRFLRSNELEQIEFEFWKFLGGFRNIWIKTNRIQVENFLGGFRNIQEKLENYIHNSNGVFFVQHNYCLKIFSLFFLLRAL